jgi:hypothetical protein
LPALTCSCPAVEVAGGFVGQQQLRLHGDGPRNRHLLALAAGQLARPMPQATAQPQALDQFEAALAAHLGLDAGQDHRQLDVLQGVQAWNQVAGLEHEADPAAAQLGAVRLG